MNLTKRLIIATCLVLMAFSGAVLGQHSSALAAGGNSLAAAACQQAGYLTIIGTNGTTDTTFTNTGNCVSYAAHGGTLVSQTAATPCLNGGYATLTSTSGSPAFASEAACVLFLGQGGVPVPVDTFTVTAGPGLYPAWCTLTFTGSGLQPNSYVYITQAITAFGTVINYTFPIVETTANSDGSLNFTDKYYSQGETYTFSAQSATGQTLYSTAHC